MKLVEVGEDQERSLEERWVQFPFPRGPQIPTYSLGWEKAFRIPRGRPPWKAWEEGGVGR